MAINFRDLEVAQKYSGARPYFLLGGDGIRRIQAGQISLRPNLAGS